MKYLFLLFSVVFVAHAAQSQQLIQIVEKYVHLGEHRTGTPTDLATSKWLGEELKSYGYDIKFLEFPTRQFFPGKVFVSQASDTITAFPLWVINEKSKRIVDGAHQFLETSAPPKDKTHLWLHLGAGATTLKWTKTESELVKYWRA